MVMVDGVSVDLGAGPAAVGIVVARGARTEPSAPALLAALEEGCARARGRGGAEALTTQVRDLLRHGKYRPTGRGKPASEYLVRAAVEGAFPRINNLVDINNLISLDTLLPISLVDLALAQTSAFVVRWGRSGESYVFNAAGQTIDLADLLLVATLPDDQPCANPVKDSMRTKLVPASTDVMAVLYAPLALETLLAEATQRFARMLEEHGSAARAAWATLRREG